MKLYTVVGMHRSGTSIIARGLNLLGASLGPAEDLMPPKEDNPQGFWESLAITQLHDDLFAYMGRRWDHPPVLEDGWENERNFDGFVERIAGIVTSHFAGAELAFWKDPRGSFFLPLWRRSVPLAGTLHCVRWPDQVARSLARREGLDPEFVAAIWIRYVVTAYRDAAGAPILRFEEPYEDPDAVLRKLAAFLGVDPPSASLLGEFRAFVKPGLRHETPDHPSPGRVLGLARAIYTLITTQPREVVSPLIEVLSDRFRLERYIDDQGDEMRAYRDLLGPSVFDILRDIDVTRIPA